MPSLLAPLIASALTIAAPALDQPRKGEIEAVRALTEAADAAEAGDCARALKATREARSARTFANQHEMLRAAILHVAVTCQWETGAREVAYRDALAATALAESDDTLWRLRLGYEIDAGLHDAVVASVEAMSNGRGAALNAIPIAWLYQADRAMRTLALAPLRRRLLAVLAADGYHPDEPSATNEAFRFRYAAVLHDAGETTAALAIVRAMTHPSLVIDLSLDPRFRAAFPTDPDVRALTERRLVALREDAARHPDAIAPVNEVAAHLRALGRPREALAALEAIRPAVTGDTALVDGDEQRVWWWDQLSRAHAMAGDYPAAEAALRAGGALREGASDNVSQVINLAQFQLDAGRPRDALATLAVFDGPGRGVSGYGMMQVVATRGCARAQLEGAAAAKEAIAFARAHVADAPDALTGLLLCAGDLDGAAASVIARLGDADQRAGALRALSTFDDPPVAPPADPVRARLAALRGRADVRAAAARAGGPRRFNVQDVAY